MFWEQINNIFHESCTGIESTYVILETFDIKVLINREGAERSDTGSVGCSSIQYVI